MLYTVFEYYLSWPLVTPQPNFMKWHTGSIVNDTVGTWFPILSGMIAED